MRASAKVAVMTDCSVLRAGFERIIEEPDLTLVGFASSSDEMLGLIASASPDIVIVPSADGALEACAAISRRHPTLPILVLSTVLDDGTVRGAIESGAKGFLFKDVDLSEFRSAIKRLVSGESVLDPRATGRVIAWAAQRPVRPEDEGLSPREIEVLRHVVQGEPNKRIARHMGITENTVKTYLRRAYKKLDCHSRSAAAAAVARRGLI
jgi:DNA-binding NarL/FixJ family response regulator